MLTAANGLFPGMVMPVRSLLVFPRTISLFFTSPNLSSSILELPCRTGQDLTQETSLFYCSFSYVHVFFGG